MEQKKDNALVVAQLLDDQGVHLTSKDISILKFTVIDDAEIRKSITSQFNLAYDCLKLRSGEHFNYQLLRAIDFLRLFNRQYLPI